MVKFRRKDVFEKRTKIPQKLGFYSNFITKLLEEVKESNSYCIIVLQYVGCLII